ncbi:MAG: MarR family winged helix-turn-helix transcriptional regulator [Actinomycetota bacterium]|nr:MarR family winged helix-turn-helix transcriptional regulator [Actinomycetota bacterium]
MHSPPTPPLGPLPDPTLADLVTAVARRLRAGWREQLAPLGISPHQGRALLVVAGEPGLRLTDLAGRLRIAPRSVTEVVDGLVALDLVQRRPDPRDRRATTLALTPTGLRTVATIEGSRTEATDALFETVSTRDRAHLRRILTGLVTDEP